MKVKFRRDYGLEIQKCTFIGYCSISILAYLFGNVTGGGGKATTKKT
jgi:hypothetical protein